MRRKVINGVLLLCFLAACSAPVGVQQDYQPEAPGAGLSVWEAGYPLQYKDWQASVHGQVHLDGDDNAPDCTGCHIDPASGEVQTAAFQSDIHRRCARCHSDEARMSQYGVSTDVVETYLADYHGTTIEFYRAVSPDAHRAEADCSDCHGSHAILPPEDDRSSVAAASLIDTCRKCHHDAPPNYAAAYGHYRPVRTPVSTGESPVVFWVKLFYQSMIPLILGGMVGYIGLDVRHRLRKRKSSRQPQPDEDSNETGDHER